MLTLPSVSHCLFVRNGQFDEDEGSNAAQLDQIFEAYRATGRTRLVVYFHGGLVDTAAAVRDAAELAPAYEASSAFPIFVIWQTGWAEVVDQNLPWIFGERIFQRLVARVSQFVKGKLEKAASGTSKGLDDLPLDKLYDIENELKMLSAGGVPFSNLHPQALAAADTLTDVEAAQVRWQIEHDVRLQVHVQEIANARRTDTGAAARAGTTSAAAASLMDPAVLDEIAPPLEGTRGLASMAMLGKHVVVITASVIRRLAGARDHGIYLTIVEEILRELYVRAAGKFLWDHMKEAVDHAFDAGDTRMGRALIRHLRSTLDLRDHTVTLVGHSAGSIYVCRLLEEIERSGLPDTGKVNVVLLAPACTFDLLERTLTRASHRIGGLRIFGMGDALERRDAIASVAYPASLLYFVSGVLEGDADTPLAGMQRYFSDRYHSGQFPAIQSARRSAPMQHGNVTIWSPTPAGGAGVSCDMTSHGGWGAAAQTLASVQHIIREGYGKA
jgi:hypothetical protein